MVKIIIYQHKDYGVLGFKSSGHAGFEDAGKDIVCAGVSVLIINTVNSLDQFTDNQFDVNQDAEEGYIAVESESGFDDRGKLLLDSMILGLKEIQKNYGDEYVTITFQEVQKP